MLDAQKDINPESCIYRIVRKESQYGFDIVYRDIFDELCSVTMVRINDYFQQYAKSCVGENINIDQFFEKISKDRPMSKDTLTKTITSKQQMKEILSIQAVKMKSSYWAEVNKKSVHD